MENQRFLLIGSGVVIAAIIVVIVIARLTNAPSTTNRVDDRGHGRCAVAREALDAFDRGRPPPPEWIQDRAEAERAVKECDRN